MRGGLFAEQLPALLCVQHVFVPVVVSGPGPEVLKRKLGNHLYGPLYLILGQRAKLLVSFPLMRVFFRAERFAF